MERRILLQWLAASATISACQQSPRVYDMQVSRDVGCPCCHVWTEMMEKTGRFKVAMTDVPDLPAYKQQLGVPAGLGACHTGLVDGFVIEGHVPAEDILKLLEQRPAGVKGIAVPGMPRGSPGMEQPNGAIDAFTVVAWNGSGVLSDFTHHAGNT